MSHHAPSHHPSHAQHPHPTLPSYSASAQPAHSQYTQQQQGYAHPGLTRTVSVPYAQSGGWSASGAAAARGTGWGQDTHGETYEHPAHQVFTVEWADRDDTNGSANGNGQAQGGEFLNPLSSRNANYTDHQQYPPQNMNMNINMSMGMPTPEQGYAALYARVLGPALPDQPLPQAYSYSHSHPQPQPQPLQAQHPPPAQPPLPHSYSAPTYPYPYHAHPQPPIQAQQSMPTPHTAPYTPHPTGPPHSPLSAPAAYPFPQTFASQQQQHTYATEPRPHTSAPARPPPPPPPLPTPAVPATPLSPNSQMLSTDPWVNPAPAYQHPSPSPPPRPSQPPASAPSTSTSTHPNPNPSPSSLPPLPPKPAFYHLDNPSSSWSSQTPGLTRDSATLSDLLERASLAESVETLPPFSSLPPGYTVGDVLPESRPAETKKLPSRGRDLPDPRLLALEAQERRDRGIALRLAQEEAAGGEGLQRRGTVEWQGFDEVAHDAAEGTEEGERERWEREERMKIQEEADRAFALSLQEQDAAAAANRTANASAHPEEEARSPQEVADEAEKERRRRQEEEDAEFARRLMEEMRAAQADEQRLREERSRREEGDERLAREMQDTTGSNTPELPEEGEELDAVVPVSRREEAERERAERERADEELARRLDGEARQAEARIEENRRAHAHDPPTASQSVQDDDDEALYEDAPETQPPAESALQVSPPPSQPTFQPSSPLMSAQTHLSPTSPRKAVSRSPVRELPEIDEEGWQVYDPTSFSSTHGDLPADGPSGAGDSVSANLAGQDSSSGPVDGRGEGSRHTEVWIRPGVYQQQNQANRPEPNGQALGSVPPGLSPPNLSPPPPASPSHHQRHHPHPAPPSPSRVHPTMPIPQPLTLLPTPTSPSSALHPFDPFSPPGPHEPHTDTPPPFEPHADTPPPFTAHDPLPPEPEPAPSPSAPEEPPVPAYEHPHISVRRPSLLPENLTFDLHANNSPAMLGYSGVPVQPVQPVSTPGSNPMRLYPHVFNRTDLPVRNEQIPPLSPPEVVTSPPTDPPAETIAEPPELSSATSPSPNALSPSRSSCFTSRSPNPEGSPSSPGITRTSSSASTKSNASGRSQRSFHTAPRASIAASLATALEHIESEEETDQDPADDQRSPAPESFLATPPAGAELKRAPSTEPVSSAPPGHLQSLPDVAIGFNAPQNDPAFYHRHQEPMLFPDLVLLETVSPLYISANTYRALLRALAHFGSVRVEAPPNLIATVKTVVQTNTVVQFSRLNAQSRDWRCILHLEVHPSQQGVQPSGGRGTAPSSIKARSNALNTVITLPQPSPVLPFTLSSLADYLRKALSDSRSASSDSGKALHRAVVQSDPEEAAKNADAPTRQGLLGVFGLGKNVKRTDLNEDTYDLVTPFILTDN
ncbi:hypothetical protein DACRYDRAFT_111492 [Dacryopinax primogenitus]|uniref:Uncharacterized protein n=1 Tax=Dacryopinax primogenitus (strain DJM 731) TaxID=1858805 RepID=M5FWY6_DACPD|nr:uncharacterized protein DACRYDRAFT_111492 [Dacryopinax primogenitus]EJT97976.1 hypothetical protein DACRYDRAFT_111492 [Dacryopinax primogenitus]